MCIAKPFKRSACDTVFIPSPGSVCEFILIGLGLLSPPLQGNSACQGHWYWRQCKLPQLIAVIDSLPWSIFFPVWEEDPDTWLPSCFSGFSASVHCLTSELWHAPASVLRHFVFSVHIFSSKELSFHSPASAPCHGFPAIGSTYLLFCIYTGISNSTLLVCFLQCFAVCLSGCPEIHCVVQPHLALEARIPFQHPEY